MIATWHAPLFDGSTSEELVLSFNEDRERRVLVVPALFDEANKMRRFTVQVMRALDRAGLDSFLPDLPGQNESLVPLTAQTLEGWREKLAEAVRAFEATEVLTVRAGAALAPSTLPTTLYAPHEPAKQVRSMLRAQVIASREAGREETTEALIETGLADGLTLAGWSFSPAMFRELTETSIAQSEHYKPIEQKMLGGRGLWLRAEPDEDVEQAEALALLIAGEREQLA